jgi:RecB family endonuclease NucS
MPTEKDVEDALAGYPELIEDGLLLTGRQKVLYGRRVDLVFEDRIKRQLLIELKMGPLKDEHIGQLMSYEGTLLSGDRPDLRVMLIGTRVPPNIRRSLDHHGIAWKEIKLADVIAFLRTKEDAELASAFDDVDSLARTTRTPVNSAKTFKRQESPTVSGRVPALLAPVHLKWLKQGHAEL